MLNPGDFTQLNVTALVAGAAFDGMIVVEEFAFN
jgi:hypothetical protein